MNASVIDFLRNFLVFLSLFMFVAGLAGNCLTYKIFSSALRKNTLSTYFRTMSIFNNLMLVMMVNKSLDEFFDWSLPTMSNFACKFLTYAGMFLGCIPAWLLVTVSLDRFVNISRPNKFPILFNRTFQLALCIFLIVYNLLLYSPLLWTSQLQTVGNSSVDCVDIISRTTSWVDLLNSTLLPFVSMITFTILLIYYIKSSRRRMDGKSLTMSKEKTRDRKFTVTAITLNIIFFILNVPITVVQLVLAYIDVSPQTADILYFVSVSFYYYFYAIDFYVQLMFNSIIRRKFFSLVNLRITKTTTTTQGNNYAMDNFASLTRPSL